MLRVVHDMRAARIERELLDLRLDAMAMEGLAHRRTDGLLLASALERERDEARPCTAQHRAARNTSNMPGISAARYG